MSLNYRAHSRYCKSGLNKKFLLLAKEIEISFSGKWEIRNGIVSNKEIRNFFCFFPKETRNCYFWFFPLSMAKEISFAEIFISFVSRWLFFYPFSLSLRKKKFLLLKYLFLSCPGSVKNEYAYKFMVESRIKFKGRRLTVNPFQSVS